MMLLLDTLPSSTPPNTQTYTLPVFPLGMPLRSKAFYGFSRRSKAWKDLLWRSCYKTALEIEYQIIFPSRGKTVKCTGVQPETELGWEPGEPLFCKRFTVGPLDFTLPFHVYLLILS